MALGLAVFAATSSAAGAVFAAAASGDLSPYTTAGVGAAAVGALVYLTKRFTDGTIVSVKIDTLIKEAHEREEHYIRAGQEREDKMRDVAKRGQDREDLLWGLLKGHGA